MGLVRPIEAFTIGEHAQVVGPADIFEDTHPYVRTHPSLFVPVVATVEEASATPGTKRARGN